MCNIPHKHFLISIYYYSENILLYINNILMSMVLIINFKVYGFHTEAKADVS